MARQPRHVEIADTLRERIHDGTYEIGTTLPKYADLTEEFGVGRGVVSSALQTLEREGLVRVVKRSGIRVLDWRLQRRRIERGQAVMRDPSRGYVFPAAARADEPWTTHGAPRRSWEPAPENVAPLLGVEPGISVLRRRRVTSPVGEPPFQVVDTWLSPEAVRDAPRVAEASTGPGGYIDRLEEAGHGPIGWVEHTRGRLCTREEAALLDVSDGTAVLELTLAGRSASTGAAVDVTVRVIPAERVELVNHLQRDDSAQWPVDPVLPESA